LDKQRHEVAAHALPLQQPGSSHAYDPFWRALDALAVLEAKKNAGFCVDFYLEQIE
jgi:hypothetical protein